MTGSTDDNLIFPLVDKILIERNIGYYYESGKTPESWCECDVILHDGTQATLYRYTQGGYLSRWHRVPMRRLVGASQVPTNDDLRSLPVGGLNIGRTTLPADATLKLPPKVRDVLSDQALGYAYTSDQEVKTWSRCDVLLQDGEPAVLYRFTQGYTISMWYEDEPQDLDYRFPVPPQKKNIWSTDHLMEVSVQRVLDNAGDVLGFRVVRSVKGQPGTAVGISGLFSTYELADHSASKYPGYVANSIPEDLR